MSLRLREAFYPECEVVHMALSCCSKGSSRYIVLAITACFISNYPVFSLDIQHLLCEMIAMAPNDRVGLTTYSLLIHCLSSLIAARANTYGGVIRRDNTIFFQRTLHAWAKAQTPRYKITGVYSQVSEQLQICQST